MNILTRYQNYILAGVAVILLFIGYSYFFGKEEEPLLKEEQVAELQNPVDQELIALLLELRGIDLDETIFKDMVFLSLQDFSQVLVPEPVGRTNPFAPYGGSKP